MVGSTKKKYCDTQRAIKSSKVEAHLATIQDRLVKDALRERIKRILDPLGKPYII